MKRKKSLHSVSSKTQSPSPKGKAIDYRETGAVGRRSFVRKIGIAGASLASVLALLVTSSAMANDIVVKFNGGIGVIPASTIGSANAVQGIQPPGEPWVIRALSAEVQQGGRIHVEGRGLLLAGGNGIGTNGGQQVFATPCSWLFLPGMVETSKGVSQRFLTVLNRGKWQSKRISRRLVL